MPEPLRDVVVVLPGITGSVLRRGDGEIVWGWSGKALLKDVITRGRSLVDALTLHDDSLDRDRLDDDITAPSLVPDLHLFPGLWKIDGYTKVTDTIKQRCAVETGKNYFEFPYDWRRDNRVAARALQRKAHEWLAARRATHPGARLILIAHSMGGLIARYYLEVLEGWKDTRALITFGTPYRGSLNAVDTLANGQKKGPMGMIDLSSMARSFTAIYQLLPVYACITEGQGGTACKLVDAPDVPNVDPAKVRAAAQFHAEIADAVVANRQLDAYRDHGYRIYPVVGVMQPTSQSAYPRDGSMTMVRELGGFDYAGDGTVPRVSAVPAEWHDAAQAMFAATRHGSLQNADAVLDQVEGIVTGLDIDLSTYLGPAARQAKVKLDVDDVYWQDTPLSVQVGTSEPATVTVTLADTARGTVVGQKTLKSWPDTFTTVELPPPGPGTYRVRVSGDDVVPAEDAVEVAPFASTA
jgi:hypothetical protein